MFHFYNIAVFGLYIAFYRKFDSTFKMTHVEVQSITEIFNVNFHKRRQGLHREIEAVKSEHV